MAKQGPGKPAAGLPFPEGFERNFMSRRFLVPGIMLLLAEEPSHGYALLDKLVAMGIAEKRLPLPMIYKALRYLEMKKYATSSMTKQQGRGPARKVYHLTEKGWKELASWSERMKSVKAFADEFQARFKSLKRSGGR